MGLVKLWPPHFFKALATIRLSLAFFSFLLLMNPGFAESSGPNSEELKRYFLEHEHICKRARSFQLAVNLCQPFLIMHIGMDRIYASESDADGALKLKDGVYQSQRPESLLIANTSVEWSGKKWVQVIFESIPGSKMEREILFLHESWHAVQEEAGFKKGITTNEHLNTEQGRTWLRLEWQALKMGLDGKTTAERVKHLTAALQFRQWRQSLFRDAKSEEDILENNEGVAESIAITLADAIVEEKVEFLKKRMNIKEQGDLARDFAYVTIPLYGLLINRRLEWLEFYKKNSDLAATVNQFMIKQDRKIFLKNLSLDESEIIAKAQSYGYSAIHEEEVQRDLETQKKKTLITTQYEKGPRLVLPVNKISMSFNPQDTFPMGKAKIFYTIATVQSEWGTIIAKEGVLVDRANNTVTVRVRDLISDKPEGPGWELNMKTEDGWRFEKESKRNRFIVKKTSTK